MFSTPLMLKISHRSFGIVPDHENIPDLWTEVASYFTQPMNVMSIKQTTFLETAQLLRIKWKRNLHHIYFGSPSDDEEGVYQPPQQISINRQRYYISDAMFSRSLLPAVRACRRALVPARHIYTKRDLPVFVKRRRNPWDDLPFRSSGPFGLIDDYIRDTFNQLERMLPTWADFRPSLATGTNAEVVEVNT